MATAILEMETIAPVHHVGTGIETYVAQLYARARWESFDGNYHEAERLFQRTIAMSERVLGQTHPDTAAALNDYGLLLEDLGRKREAEEFYRRALRIYQVAVEPGSHRVRSTREHLMRVVMSRS